jgi:putative ABC transport system ATP-binding protein
VPEPRLSAQDVSVAFGQGAASAVVLDNASATFRSGEVTLLFGASGSGKTTFLSILGLLRKPDRGNVILSGEDLARAPERRLAEVRRKDIGFVFQFFRLFRSLTAVENVGLGLELSESPRKGTGLAEEALEAVGLSTKRRLLPQQMSGGERQRVAIARALVKKPGILLADEPTAALDTASGMQIAELIRTSVKTRGLVAVVATHDARLITIADRVIEMCDGRIRERERSMP